VTEGELQENVVKMAHLLRWRVAHFRPAQNAAGRWSTPVAADGAGFPDLVMVRDRIVIYAELKSDGGRLSDAQKDWLAVLPNSCVWRPVDWKSGEIERILRGLITKSSRR
jgi:hypothetical protein